jgi:hypothetical protein
MLATYTAQRAHAVQAEADASKLEWGSGFMRPRKEHDAFSLPFRSCPHPPQYVCRKNLYKQSPHFLSLPCSATPTTPQADHHGIQHAGSQDNLCLQDNSTGSQIKGHGGARAGARGKRQLSVVSPHGLFTGLKQPFGDVDAAYVGLSAAFARGYSSSEQGTDRDADALCPLTVQVK